MSIKIFNGYLFPQNDLAAAIAHLSSIRAEVSDCGTEVISAYYARRAAEKIDQSHQRGETLEESPLAGLLVEVLDRQREAKKSGLRDHEVDTEASAVILPANGKVLVMVFAEHASMRDIITRGLIPHQYWDSTDKPDDVSEEEWEKRRQDWETALGADPLWRPAACGPVIEFVQSNEFPNPEKVLEQLPTRDKRARDLLRSEIFAEMLSSGKQPKMSDLMKAADESSWDESRRDRLSIILNGLPEITLDVLRGPEPTSPSPLD